MTVTTSHSHTPKSEKFEFQLSWHTRLGRPLLDDFDTRKAMIDALEETAARNDVRLLSIASTAAVVTLHVEAPPTISASLLMNRLKVDSARAIMAHRPEFRTRLQSIWRRSGIITPIASLTRMPTHAGHRAAVTRLDGTHDNEEGKGVASKRTLPCTVSRSLTDASETADAS